MTQEIQWGPAIAVDGKRPVGVQDADVVDVQSSNGANWFSTSVLGLGAYPYASMVHWQTVKVIRLPADHPYYRQTEEAPIDWSGELEAVHEDGRVVAVTLVVPVLWGGTNPDNDGSWWTTSPTNRGTKTCWDRNGRREDQGWHIRNVPQPTPQADTKPDLTARMEALVRKMNETGSLHYAKSCDPLFDEARAIVALLPEPVGPDLIEAREIANLYSPTGADYTDGKSDDSIFVKVALAAIKSARGRALALAGEKEA